MTDQEELTCQELVELVTDYLEEALPAPQRVRFDDHLLDCDDCPLYLDQIRTTIRVAGLLSEEQIDPAARDRLLLLFRDWKQSKP
jgi:hypothetical protein